MKDETAEYRKTMIGKNTPEIDMIDKYVPGFMDGTTMIRKSFYPLHGDDFKAAIPKKYRELIMIALEIGTGRGGHGKPGEGHTKRAIKEAGATPKEIAETIALTAYLCGTSALADNGYHCLRIAEEEYGRLTKAK